MAKKKRKTKRAATIVIHAPGKMTAAGRRDIAAWLRKTAGQLVRNGKDYTTGRFTAGYNY
jgi:hypothetical protein